MKTYKITFVGDIMCEPRMLKAAKRNDGYDFSGVFSEVGDLFEASDYVIGNLETPLAGQDAAYTHSQFSFNAPDEFMDSVQSAGINMVTTANNHCLDRGINGLLRTMKVLDKKGFPYSGTNPPENDGKEPPTFSLGDFRVAVLSYTYGTNFKANHVVIPKEQRRLVNLLRPQDEFYFKSESSKPAAISDRIVNKMLKPLRAEYRYAIKKMLHMQYNQAHEDNYICEETAASYLEKLRADIKAAKEIADLVLFFPHVGGQFNRNPGVFTKYVFDQAIVAGCDAVVASHPHVTQKAEKRKGVPCFYSLGNFSMSPNSAYLLHENLPEYGIAAHFYIENSRICRCSFSILKMVEEKRDILRVWPVEKLYNTLNENEKEVLSNDVSKMILIVTGKEILKPEILAEYACM